MKITTTKLRYWILNQRQAYRKGWLDKRQIRILESIPGWEWNVNESAWEKGYQYTLKYGLVGSKWEAPDGYRLGRWQHLQRSACKDSERRKRLEAIPGWAWSRLEAAWQRGFKLAKKYGIHDQRYETPCGYKLGKWFSAQRQHCKDPDKRKLLESLPGWKWKYTHKERISLAIISRMKRV